MNKKQVGLALTMIDKAQQELGYDFPRDSFERLLLSSDNSNSGESREMKKILEEMMSEK